MPWSDDLIEPIIVHRTDLHIYVCVYIYMYIHIYIIIKECKMTFSLVSLVSWIPFPKLLPKALWGSPKLDSEDAHSSPSKVDSKSHE